MKIVKVSDNIFREYDIRGIYNEDLNEDVAYTVGRSFASFINEKEIIIGYDNRASSIPLRNALVKGLNESGVDVIDLGLVTTSMYYFAKKKNNIKCGLMITASHNAKEYNGFKISFDYIGNAYGNFIKEFRDFTNKSLFKSGNGKIKYLNIKEDYLKLLKESIDLGDKKIKLVVDTGNGTGSIIIKEVLDMFNIEYKLLYAESDSNFPNHQPDPAVLENQIDLSKEVVKLGYDYGFSVDGDADRIGIVDEKGNIIFSDIYMALIYKTHDFIPRKAIYDVKCSRVLIDELEILHYDHTMYKTGNSYMNMKINEENYMFGGEFSGHVWFRDKFPGFDDGIYAGLRVLEILSNNDKKLSELLSDLHKYYSTGEIKIKVTDDNKFEIIEKLKKYCDSKNYKYIDVDGIRIEKEDGWAGIRASNTGPNLTLRFESISKDKLDKMKEEFLKTIEEIINEL